MAKLNPPVTWQPHHFRDLQRARDHLTGAILGLRAAVERMTGDDWIDAFELLAHIETSVAPRLSALRTAASERFDEHTRRDDFEDMRTGRASFPDQRAVAVDEAPAARHAAYYSDVTRLDAPNAHRGRVLAGRYGGVEHALRALPLNGHDANDVRAFHYVMTRERLDGFTPQRAA